VEAQLWIWCAFVFAFGCCMGSFLNVVVYRLPRDKSLIHPGSACPACGRHIRFYDNIPLISWVVLRRRCRYCKAPISARYFIIELLTGAVFLGLFVLYFYTDLRPGIKGPASGTLLIYGLHILMLSGFIAASAIDLEFWVIPLSICWFVTASGLIGSALAPLVIHPRLVRAYCLMPVASFKTAVLSVGALVGLAVAWILLKAGVLPRSYAAESTEDGSTDETGPVSPAGAEPADQAEIACRYNHRLESAKEILFLSPIVAGMVVAYWLLGKLVSLQTQIAFADAHPVLAGLLGSLWGYFVGCGVVWAVRIAGTVAFGKEAMGLGDVHLMGAAGAVVGPVLVTMAFFVAPFFGLAWAAVQMCSRKIRQIPYGPFLSLAVLVVIILQNRLLERIGFIFR